MTPDILSAPALVRAAALEAIRVRAEHRDFCRRHPEDDADTMLDALDARETAASARLNAVLLQVVGVDTDTLREALA